MIHVKEPPVPVHPGSSNASRPQDIARLCQERGVRFTPLRRIAYEVLLAAGGPASAYDLQRALELRLGRRVSPPTVYRALDFLLQQGFIRRIETRNAFVPSAHPDDRHSGVFFLCTCCGTTVEVDVGALEAVLARDAAARGFQIGRRIVELQGTCADCLSSAVQTAPAGRTRPTKI
ncbi:MAG TPA: Fur family transcriptional regulator [Paenirhodobacter sp.]